MGVDVTSRGARNRARPDRPKDPKKPRIKTTPDTTDYARTRLLFIVALFAMLGLFTFAASKRHHAPDPHYLEARRVLTAYELGKPEASRNYRHPVYQQALLELDLVESASISAKPAELLASELDELIRKYVDKHQSTKKAGTERIKRRMERNTAFFRGQDRSRLNPVTEYPECEEEKEKTGG